jgi:hypothetical protein
MNTPINEAGLSGPVIDRDTAARLMDPLTDLVARAGAAILAVSRHAMKIDGKPDGSPARASRSCCRLSRPSPRSASALPARRSAVVSS